MEMFRSQQSGEIKYGYTLTFSTNISSPFRQRGKKFPPSRGFTLTELLMAMIISAVLLAILGRFLTNFHQNREASKVMIELQAQAQFAMEHMIYGYNKNGEYYRYGGIIWASDDLNVTGKIISFTDYTDPDKRLCYEQKDGKLYHTILDGGQIEEHIIIPYLEGEQEYRQGLYNVEVNFQKGPGPDPNRVVSIEVEVSKDELTFRLNSSVTLRNYASDE